MRTVRVKGIRGLTRRLRKDMRSLERRLKNAVRTTASKGVRVVRSKQPVGFAELADSTHSEPRTTGAAIVVDAPHAAAVNNGSRPHWPPLEPIIRWVRLRGMQGLQGAAKLSRIKGVTTRQHARTVASMLAEQERGPRVRGRGSYSDTNAPERVAYAIAAKIAQSGTAPSFFIERSMPEILDLLDEQIKKALDRFDSTGDESD